MIKLISLTLQGCCVVFTILIATLVDYYSIQKSLEIKDSTGSDSFKIIGLSSWGFFILINAFYGGALTMFFTSNPDPPFETLRQAFDNPDWEVVTMTVSRFFNPPLLEVGHSWLALKCWYDVFGENVYVINFKIFLIDIDSVTPIL